MVRGIGKGKEKEGELGREKGKRKRREMGK